MAPSGHYGLRLTPSTCATTAATAVVAHVDGANHPIWGPQLQYSDDLGSSWVAASGQPRFSGESGASVERLWHIEPGTIQEPGVLYAGVEPAALFRSEDGGANWQEVVGLSHHPTRSQWEPGFGGLCLHSIVVDPRTSARMWVGISAAGVFRSDSGGAGWHDVSEGLPSRFGFVLGIHSRDPDTIYVVPEDEALGTEVGGGLRFVTGARFRVYRSRNGGGDWEPLIKGLPQSNAYLHVLREGMATDSLDPCGIYIGTTSGQIFHSRDDGDSWELLIEYLPPINSVTCAQVV